MATNDDEYLQRLYEDPESAAAFSSAGQLYREVKKRAERKISMNKIKKWLMKNPIYTQNRQAIRKFKRRRMIVPYIGYQSDVDQSYMENYAEFNDGYKYFLLMIDNFSKFVWTYPLKKLDGKHIKTALKSIFETSHIKTERIRSDKGREIRNAVVDRFLKTKNVQHIVSQNETQASMAERAIKTIKSRLLKYMVKNNTKKWIDVLQRITDGYNKAYHRSIGKAPVDVTKQDESAIWNRLHLPRAVKKRALSAEAKYELNKRRFRYKVGDTVVLTLLKSAFVRGYNQKWTTEHFTVTNSFLRQGLPVYTVKDEGNRPIDGTFYSNELQKVDPQPERLYTIERVLKKRKKGGKAQVLVRWLGFSHEYDSWIPASDVKRYN